MTTPLRCQLLSNKLGNLSEMKVSFFLILVAVTLLAVNSAPVAVPAKLDGKLRLCAKRIAIPTSNVKMHSPAQLLSLKKDSSFITWAKEQKAKKAPSKEEKWAALVNSMNKLPADLVRHIAEQYMYYCQYLPSGEIIKKLSVQIFHDDREDGKDIPVRSSAINYIDLSGAEIGIQLENGTVLNVQWRLSFKASDGTEGIKGHAERFHAACDGEGATMTVSDQNYSFL